MSAATHGFLLAWLILAAAQQPFERPRNLYQQEIQPFEKHLVWYSLRDKLPDVKPANANKERKAPRARVLFNQSIVAGKKDNARPPQMIAMPAPAIELPKPLPLPNALAVTAPPLARRFLQPPAPKPPLPTVHELATPPVLQSEAKASAVDLATVAARPVRAFAPPPAQARKPEATALLALPDGLRLAAPAVAVALPTASAVPRRAFVDPAASNRLQRQSTVTELAAPPPPQLTAAVPSTMPRIPRGFTPPPLSKSAEPAPVAAELTPPVIPDASPTPGASASLVIVGLTPANTLDIPPPPGSHEAGFSAGTRLNPTGADMASNDSARVTIPGLSARGGANDQQPTLVSVLAPPTSRQNLLAAMHGAIPAPTVATGARAARSAAPPDSRLAGRYVYTLAIQMPNVTSYSGSWMVWFAEHDSRTGPDPGDLRPPVALRKVDPKYIQSAVEERVEGTVRLAAVIRKTGRVDSVELLKHLDERLDRSAQEALVKWEFEPAQRNGSAIDIDAVFEIPFRLAPKPKR